MLPPSLPRFGRVQATCSHSSSSRLNSDNHSCRLVAQPARMIDVEQAAAKAMELGVIPPGSSSLELHAQAQLRPSAAGPRQADQLRVAPAGSRLDPPDAHLPGVGTGPDRQPGVGALKTPI